MRMNSIVQLYLVNKLGTYSDIIADMKATQWTYNTYNNGKGQSCIVGFLCKSLGIKLPDGDNTDIDDISEQMELSPSNINDLIHINDKSPDFIRAQHESIEYLEDLEL